MEDRSNSGGLVVRIILSPAHTHLGKISFRPPPLFPICPSALHLNPPRGPSKKQLWLARRFPCVFVSLRSVCWLRFLLSWAIALPAGVSSPICDLIALHEQYWTPAWAFAGFFLLSPMLKLVHRSTFRPAMNTLMRSASTLRFLAPCEKAITPFSSISLRWCPDSAMSSI